MATYKWSVPPADIISGSTLIKDTDNKIQNTIDDLVDFVNGEASYAGFGLTYDFVDKASAQTISGVKTFSGGLIGTLTGSITGNAPTSDKLTTPRTISLTGDVTGSVSFDGSVPVSMTTTITDNSHVHPTSSITGLDTFISSTDTSLGTKITSSDYATSTTGGTIKLRMASGVLYITTTGSNA